MGNFDVVLEVNGFEGYSIYEIFIYGESNYVICVSCGILIEKSLLMYIVELDWYWYVNCFSCVVCRVWFGDEYSLVFYIINFMLYCERCYIMDEGKWYMICFVRLWIFFKFFILGVIVVKY